MTKKKVAIVIDSTAYVPEELVKQYDLHVIPLTVNWEGDSLLDNVDITPEEFYARLGTAKEMPTTSQPSAGAFHELYSKVAETAESIISIHISSELSGTLASAHAAAQMMPDFPIEIIDSRSTSMGLGYMALTAARAIENGADYKTAAELVRGLIPEMRLVFVVDTLEFLHRGGRIGGAKRLIGSMLSIKPLLHLEDGKVEPLASVRTRKKAVNHMLKIAQDELSGKTNVRMSILYTTTPDDADILLNQVQELINPDEINKTKLSPVIGTHIGPGALGLLYYAAP